MEGKKIVPHLRFPEFSSCWENKAMNRLFLHIRNGFVGIATPYYVINDGVPYIQGKDIKNGILSTKSLERISLKFHNAHKNSQLKQNDLVMVQSGHIGQCAVVETSLLPANCHAILILSPKLETESNFVKYYFCSYFGISKIAKITTGNTVQHILASDVSNIHISVPEYSEQQKISDFLSKVDSWITNLKSQKHELENYKKGLMQKIFSQQIRFKDKNGDSYPVWQTDKLGVICTLIKDGTHGSHLNIDNSGYWLLSAKNIFGGTVNIDKTDRQIPKKDFESIYKSCEITKGDLLLTTVGTIGNVAIFDGRKDIVFQRSVTFFRFKDGVSKFYYYLFAHSNFQKELKRRQVVSAQPGIYLGDLSIIPVSIPIFDEQQKIADFLTSVDKIIESKQNQIQQVEIWKKGLLQQMFI